MSLLTRQPSSKSFQSNGQSKGVTKQENTENWAIDPNCLKSENPGFTPEELPESQAKTVDKFQEPVTSQETPLIKLKKDFNPNPFNHEN
ncbi:hypothetical protein O181_058455 [Austropuccinia psidii MF-1]|uniref:Uncharacterized protein n=1 Tax=Austropuccinia psidii MF-1 TaxID=1389203 RepID=A0A9Q3HXV8_9BASI|nr:hypothetical protein [Austropuccinia psidii MF-1]